MAFENNQILRDIVGLSQLAQKGATDLDALRQQAAQEAMAKEAPRLLAQAGMEQPLADFAGLSVAGGDPALLRELISKQFGKSGSQAIGAERASILGQGVGMTDPALLNAISTMDEKGAQGFLGLAQRKAQGDKTVSQKERSLGLQAQGQQRLQREELQKQANNFKSDVSKFEKEVADQEKALSTVKSALSTGTKPSQVIIENFVLRKLGGDTGPLSDKDREAVASKAGFNNYQIFENFITGNPYSTWTDSQKEAFKDLVNMAADKFSGYKDQRASDILGQSNNLMAFSDSERGRSLKDEFAKKHGFSGNAAGGYKKESKKEKFSLNNETPIDKIVEAIEKSDKVSPDLKKRVRQQYDFSLSNKSKQMNRQKLLDLLR